MKRIAIFGATSAIAQACARIWAARGDALFLVGRKAERLEAIAGDLGVRGAKSVRFEAHDLADLEAHPALVDHAFEALGGIDVALVAHGALGDPVLLAQDAALAAENIALNFVSAASLLTCLANRMEAQGGGSLAVISSVAGDRGRQSNYVYGSAKAGLTAFASGLRNRLHRRGVHVLTVKPGMVDTPMTAHMKKSALFASPEAVAKGIVRAIDRRKDVVYVPGFWRAIMWVIRSIPERVFKRLSL
ncbi:MAG TPA: SDR family oxidoreductase [Fredinandcohnia sp.]|nr:SDR family oxidoreductase [Fredinandcohnia sp.]